jgi:hypothetical protein
MSAGICITYCGYCVQQHKAEERTRGFKVDITPLVRLALYRTVFLKKLGSGKHIDPKFGRREGCVSYYRCQDKKVPERRSVFVLLRKNFRNGVPSQKYPWLYIDLLWRFIVHVNRVNYSSELRPLTGLLFYPRRYMSIESHGGTILTQKTEEFRENPVPVPLCPPQYPTWTDPGKNSGLHDDRQATNRMSHGTAKY